MGKRRKHDFYPTGMWMTEQLLRHVPSIGGIVLEPCVGEQDMSNVLRAHAPVGHLITNDIDLSRNADFHYDARAPYLYDGSTYDWIVTNPPFSDAFEILQRSYESARDGVAFLLRLSFIEPTYDRGQWLAAHPPSLTIVLPRYSFTRNGKTDSVTCAWFVWDKRALGQRVVVVPRETRDGDAK